MRPKLTLLFLVFFFVTSVFSQSFSNALNLFISNNRTKAIEEAKKIESGNKEYAEAQLLLCFCYLEIDKEKDAFNCFKNFYKNHPEPYAYAYAIWNKGFMNPDDEDTEQDVIDFCNELIKSEKTPAFLKGLATSSIAFKLQKNNKISESKKIFATLNDIKNWATLGTFENVSSSGFNKNFNVLEHPEAEYTFTNSRGNPIKWFNIEDSRNDRWCDMEFHHDISNSIIYNQTFLKSESDQEVILKLGVSGSVKLWLNDALLINEVEERNTDIDVFSIKAKLNNGYNRVLIQLGSSEIENNNFMLRFTDLNGNLLPAFSSTQQP